MSRHATMMLDKSPLLFQANGRCTQTTRPIPMPSQGGQLSTYVEVEDAAQQVHGTADGGGDGVLHAKQRQQEGGQGTASQLHIWAMEQPSRWGMRG